jgi:hypothetical protein
MAPRPHILVVNGRKVRQPVFVIGTPHSGADLVGRALKQTQGIHLTIGHEAVQGVVYAFARSPAIRRGKAGAAATVLRDAFAQAWQVTAHGCLTCSPLCRDAGQVNGRACCVEERDIVRYGDASPDLMYCAEDLIDAFADARLIQVIRDGRDVVAAMLADPQAMAWFKPSIAKIDGELPNPYYGIETEDDRESWQRLSPAGRVAMRWRGSVRAMARLRAALSAEQLTTLRYEDMLQDPVRAAAAISHFTETTVSPDPIRAAHRAASPAATPGHWRTALEPVQAEEIDQVAGQDLLRIGYGS